jgi:predicted DNA-binding transcriptional regulator YafY
MRADRLLSIMLLLQVHRRLTARELAERLEVSERTIHRDMDALSTAGIPVTAERGSSGGWTLLGGYQTRLTGLTEAEIQALFLAQPARLLADLGLEKASEAALLKLTAALPARSVSRRDAEYVRQRIHVDIAGWNRYEEAVPCLPLLQDAIWHDRQLRLTYQRSDDSVVERVVDPLGLVAKGTVWYLVASVEGEFRTYRVSRVKSAEVMDQPCVRPADFDLATHWEQSKVEFKANLPRYPVTLRAASEVVTRMSAWRYARVEQVSAPEADGWVKVNVMFEVDWDARESVLSLSPQIEVLDPPELREAVIEAVERTLALYRSQMVA